MADLDVIVVDDGKKSSNRIGWAVIAKKDKTGFCVFCGNSFKGSFDSRIEDLEAMDGMIISSLTRTKKLVDLGIIPAEVLLHEIDIAYHEDKLIKEAEEEAKASKQFSSEEGSEF